MSGACTHVNFAHLAATPPSAHHRLRRHHPRHIEWRVHPADEVEEIGLGTHARAVIGLGVGAAGAVASDSGAYPS
jgi:predicted thioesterase